MARYNGGNAKVPVIEKIIADTLGVAAQFEPQFDRLKIPTDTRVQSRIDRNNAPTAMVNRYVHQMSEFEFPPIVLTEDFIKIDGNTREKAHAKRGERYIPALVVPIKWEGADLATQRKLLYVSELLNNQNGLPLDDGERKKMARNMIEMGSSDDEIVGKVGFSLARVRELREQHKGEERLRSVGISPDTGHISDVVRAFGKPTPQGLDENTFVGLAQLTADAGLKSSEISAMATELAQQGTEELKQNRLLRERQARDAQITARRTGQHVPRLAESLRRKLAVLLEHPLTAFVEHDPGKVAEHTELLEKAEEILRNIRTAQASIPAVVAATQATGTVQ